MRRRYSNRRPRPALRALLRFSRQPAKTSSLRCSASWKWALTSMPRAWCAANRCGTRAAAPNCLPAYCVSTLRASPQLPLAPLPLQTQILDPRPPGPFWSHSLPNFSPGSVLYHPGAPSVQLPQVSIRVVPTFCRLFTNAAPAAYMISQAQAHISTPFRLPLL